MNKSHQSRKLVKKTKLRPVPRRKIATKHSAITPPIPKSAQPTHSLPSSPVRAQFRPITIPSFAPTFAPVLPAVNSASFASSQPSTLFPPKQPFFTPQPFSLKKQSPCFPIANKFSQFAKFSTTTASTSSVGTQSASPQSTKPSHFTTTTSLDEDGIEVPPHLEKQYKRLLFQSQQRGWLELDLIFTAYVKTYKKDLLNETSLQELTVVCDCDNSDLIRWFVEGHPLPEEWKSNSIMVDMLKYAHNPNKPWYPGANNGNQ